MTHFAFEDDMMGIDELRSLCNSAWDKPQPDGLPSSYEDDGSHLFNDANTYFRPPRAPASPPMEYSDFSSYYDNGDTSVLDQFNQLPASVINQELTLPTFEQNALPEHQPSLQYDEPQHQAVPQHAPDRTTPEHHDSFTPIARSTTPELPFTAHLSSINTNGAYIVPGGFASKLASALSTPPIVPAHERAAREAAMLAILSSHKPHPLPPPSPTIKRLIQPDPFRTTHKIRHGASKIFIAPVSPKPAFEPWLNVASMPEGPERDAAMARNDAIAEAKNDFERKRNNTAATRSRDRKLRAVTHRAEAIFHLQSEVEFWKARAVGLGAGVGDWEALDENVKREMVADHRWDALDFSNDATEEEKRLVKQAKLADAAARSRKAASRKKATGGVKRKAKDMAE
ncbi:hypothetical protein CKAH01_16669 [Colletotrichum kahawae]|uniref:BZIP domain-containing protein n=1 Tax=Colletotrichum kahawae TaxID=34407 RepID=A0AAD9YEJ6_COLKA|nr:hypothetical protein CKAH01_16669 [Colletotrichum kahawae]